MDVFLDVTPNRSHVMCTRMIKENKVNVTRTGRKTLNWLLDDGCRDGGVWVHRDPLCPQVQATVVGFLASIAAVIFGWIPEGNFKIGHAVLLCASSVATAFIASLLLGERCLNDHTVLYVDYKSNVFYENKSTTFTIFQKNVLRYWDKCQCTSCIFLLIAAIHNFFVKTKKKSVIVQVWTMMIVQFMLMLFKPK